MPAFFVCMTETATICFRIFPHIQYIRFFYNTQLKKTFRKRFSLEIKIQHIKFEDK